LKYNSKDYYKHKYERVFIISIMLNDINTK